MFKYYERIMNFIYRLQLIKLKLFGAKIGKNIKVYGNFTVVGHPKKLTLEDNITINEGVFLNCRDFLSIKKNSRLSAYVKIFTTALDTNSISRQHISKKTTIEENVWLASNSLISYGVTVGKNSIIAASSVVTNDVDENSLYAGMPAKKIKTLV